LKPIGQGIDTTLFFYSAKTSKPNFSRFVHVGRLDPSKQIETILEAFSKFAKEDSNASLTLVGAPTKGNEQYARALKVKYHELFEGKQVILKGAKSRGEVAQILRESDLFIHAYEGSLDKAILEATLIGIPVVTLNRPYLDLMSVGLRKCSDSRKSGLLVEQIDKFHELKFNDYNRLLWSRSEIIRTNHDLGSWVSKVVQVLIES